MSKIRKKIIILPVENIKSGEGVSDLKGKSSSRKRKKKPQFAPVVPVKRNKPGRSKKGSVVDVKTPCILTFFKSI